MKNKFLTLLLSVGIAFGLWLYVITEVSTEIDRFYYDIPISFRGESILEDRGLMITDEQMPTVDLELVGNRSELNKLSSSNITLVVDLSYVYDPGKQNLSYNIIYPGDVSNNSIQVKSQTGQVTLNFEKRDTEEVPVNLVYTGKTTDDYIVDKANPVLEHDTVTISGPASVVSLIKQAQIEIDLDNQTQTINGSYRYRLCDAEGNPVDSSQVETNVGEVSVTVKIQRVKEIKLTVTVVDGGGATGNSASISIYPDVIKVCGSESILSGLEEWNLGTINLAEYPIDTVIPLDISLPSGITNLSEMDEAKVNLKFVNLGTTTFEISDFRVTNVPEGMEAEILTQVLKVTLRGPRSLINALRPTDITVTVDFADVEPGTSTVKVTVTMGPGFADIGAVGSPSVSATLRESGES